MRSIAFHRQVYNNNTDVAHSSLKLSVSIWEFRVNCESFWDSAVFIFLFLFNIAVGIQSFLFFLTPLSVDSNLMARIFSEK